MIDYSLGCILANVPVSYDEFEMKFICLEITLRPLHGGYEKNHGLKVNFSVRPLHEAALYTVIYGISFGMISFPYVLKILVSPLGVVDSQGNRT